MAKKTIHIDGGTSSFEIEKSKTAYVLDKNEILSFAKITTDPAGNIDDIVLTINGTLTTSTTALEIGAANSSGNRVVIGNSGIVDSRSDAIILVGDKTSVINRGSVFTSDTSNSIGITSTGDDGRFTNSGFLKAEMGFDITGDGNRIVNSGVMANYAGTIGAEFHSVSGDVNRFINTGVLHGSVGVIGGDGREIVINKGEMSAGLDLGGGNDLVVTSRYIGGDVDLGAGDDRFVLKGKGDMVQVETGAGEDVLDIRHSDAVDAGTTISGGADDDTYLVSRSDLTLDENAGQGTDTVKSSVTFNLGDEFENLILTGDKATGGNGNAAANVITGNAAKNTVLGLAGMDTLDGGAGNDILSGGTHADTFVFRTNSGKDLITDFTDMSDEIDLSGYKGIDDFGDLSGKIDQKGTDTVITLLDGDKITLGNFTATDLTMADFQF